MIEITSGWYHICNSPLVDISNPTTYRGELRLLQETTDWAARTPQHTGLNSGYYRKLKIEQHEPHNTPGWTRHEPHNAPWWTQVITGNQRLNSTNPATHRGELGLLQETKDWTAQTPQHTRVNSGYYRTLKIEQHEPHYIPWWTQVITGNYRLSSTNPATHQGELRLLQETKDWAAQTPQHTKVNSGYYRKLQIEQHEPCNTPGWTQVITGN